MAALDGLFGESASSSSGSSGGSLDTLFGKAPVPVRASAPAAAPAVTAQASKIASSVPATPNAPTSLFSKAKAGIESLFSPVASAVKSGVKAVATTPAGQAVSTYFGTTLPAHAAQINAHILDTPEQLTNSPGYQKFATSLFDAADNKANTALGFTANTGIEIAKHLATYGTSFLTGATGGLFQTPQAIQKSQDKQALAQSLFNESGPDAVNAAKAKLDADQGPGGLSGAVDGVLTSLGQALGAAETIGGLGKSLGSLATPAGFVNYLNQWPTVAKYAIPLIQNAIGFSAYGQLDPKLGNDVVARAKAFGLDMATAPLYTVLGSIGAAKYSLPASFGLGYGMARLSGASNHDAVMGGLTFAFLDGAGRNDVPGYVTGRMTEDSLKSEALSTLSKISGHDVTSNSTPEDIQAAWRAAAKKTHPDVGGDQKTFTAARSAYEVLTGKSSKLEVFDETAPSRKAGSDEKAVALLRDDATEAIRAGHTPKTIVKQMVDETGVTAEHAARIVDQASVQAGQKQITPTDEVGPEHGAAKAIRAAQEKVANPEPVQMPKAAPGSLDELLGAAKAPVIEGGPAKPKELSAQQAGMKDLSLRTAKEQGVQVTPDDSLVLYHGTDEARGPKEGDTWRVGSYFTPSKEIAERFANQGEGTNPKVMRVEVPAHAVFPAGSKEEPYYTLNEEVPVKTHTEKTQKQKVKETVERKGEASVAEIAEETKILEPNVRRILGMGAKDGTFDRVGKGVYKVKIGDQEVAYVIPGDAIETLPKLADEGFKADMVFLDIPYDTPAVKGGNRGVDYNLISVEQFGVVLDASKKILRTPDSALIHMFSQAPSGMKAMQKYNDLLIEKGFKPIARGAYTKLQKDAQTRVRNMRGAVMPPEGILILNQSGKQIENPPDLDFKMVRPKGYQTEKPAEMLKALIEMTTAPGDLVLDPFAGFGVTSEEAVKAGRKTVAIEKNEEQAGKIAERVQKTANEITSSQALKLTYEELKARAVKIKPNNFGGEDISVNVEDNSTNPLRISFNKAREEVGYGVDYSTKKVAKLDQGAAREYQTIHEGGVIKTVKGEPVDVIDGVETFLHEGDGGWIVSEASTGRFLSESRSKEGAIAKARFNIEEVGREKFISLIKTHKLTSEMPKTPEDAASVYWEKEIAPAMEAGKPTIIGADNLKDYFGKDYDDANHKLYSQAAFLLYERALKENHDDVVFTGGGPGSGKTEILVDQIAESGFKGIVYDSNMSNYEGVVKQIEMAKADDRNVEIYGITPDLGSARTFTIQRANRTGRAITDNTFARGHAGFPDVAAKLIENGIIDESDVHILDTHDVSNDLEGAIAKFAGKAFVDRPLEYLRGLGYTEDNVRQEHSAALYDSQGARSTTGSEVREESSGPSRVSGPDREAKEIKRRTPPRGFIAPGVVVEGIANKAAEVETFLEKTQQAIELSDDLALNLYKLQGANQSDLEEVAKIAKKINKVSAADNEAVYFHAEDALNPHQKPTALTERQQELYEKYDKPFADANEQLMTKIKKAGYNIPGEGYIHRVPKAYKSPLDAVLNPKERDEVKLNLGGLLKKTSTSMKRRTLMALEDEKGNRRVVSIKNTEFTIEKGKREGDVIRSKRVTGFNAEKKPEEDLGRFAMKSHKQLLDSETKPLEAKLKRIQDTIDGLQMLRIKEPLAKGRVENLEKEVQDLADTFDRQFAEGAFTAKELRPLLKKFRAREAELRVLKTVSPKTRLTNQASRIAVLTDDMREFSNELARIEGSYDPETLDQRVFVDKAGKEWKIVQATTREIEAQTNTEYYHNALASRIVQYLELNRIARALDFIESFKTDPRFSEFAVEDTGQNPPVTETGTWKRTLMPQFRKYWLEPRTADVFDNFFNYTRPNEGVLETALDATGHFLVNTIFYNPIAHPLNVTALWLADRGGTFITPTRYGAALRAFAKAFTAISKKNDDYTYALLHGAPIMNTSTNRADLAKQLYDVLASEMDRDVERSKPLAQRLGFKTVLDMKNAFGKAWHGATWIPNDILTLQAIYERMETRDLTFEEAVQETARFIPDYRMPARILGSRKVSETLQSRGLLGSVWFAAAYHFGELRSVGSIAKDIALPEGGFTKEGSAERYDALGKALMLALLATVVYSAIDKLWQKITGNPNTYMSRSGSVKLIADAMQVATGEADYTKILQAEMALNPAYLGAAELMFNTDFYTRNPIFGFPPAIGGLAFLESMVAPASAASRMSPADFALSLFNVHTPKNSPGKAAAQAQMYDEKPQLLTQVKQEIAAGQDDVAQARMTEFNQRLATNYQQALIQEGKAPATPAEVKEFVSTNGIKVPGTVAQANADKLYADNQKAGKQSLISTVATYAKAIGTDPVTAFDRIFTGQRIVRVDNASFFGPDSAVIVARDDVMEASVRAEQGQAEGFTDEQMKGLQLDHVIALELGGSNTPTNLNLVTTTQNESLHPIVENFLAKALVKGEVSRANVKQYILDYKAGTLGETLPTALEDEWKANGSKSLTAQEIFDLVNGGNAK